MHQIRELRTCLNKDLALNQSAHHWGKSNRLLSPEDGVGSVVEVLEQVLDLGAWR
jgi:hypothetical protein